MLMLAICCTLQRMERELHTRGCTHVRENPDANPTPLSPIELTIHHAFRRHLLGDDPPIDAPITIPTDAIPSA